MTNKEFAEKLINCAKNYKTLYVLGCFGAPLNASNKKRYTTNYAYNIEHAASINAASSDTFGFDCVCLLKGILWGWNGDTARTYGGATYKANGVPDIGANEIIKVCSDVSADFTDIEVGELVWMSGHVGAYVGGGLVVECSPKWANKVQITACNRDVKGYNRRNWTKHGKLPYITYVKEEAPVAPSDPTPALETAEIEVGSVVRFKDSATNYYPGSKTIPSWVKTDYCHVVTQTTYKGKPYTKGGKTCVLLGKKRKTPDSADVAGINTWVALDNLVYVREEPVSTCNTYTVKKGDCLWAIARTFLGNGARYPEIVALNGLKSTTILVGQVLKIPTK